MDVVVKIIVVCLVVLGSLFYLYSKGTYTSYETLTNGKIHIKSRNVVIEADNFEQINTSNLENEENVADIILGG